MLTKMETNEKFQEEEYSQITRGVFFIINIGRTILKWRPRRFGGGLGDLRLTKDEAKKH